MIARRARPVVVAFAMLAAVALPTVAQERRPTLVAVFAHADDEFVIGPLLARYAREGADVHLLIVTRGEKYAPETGLTPGDEIARVRASEAQCVARTLGINVPILLGFDDGGLGQPVMPPWATLGDAREQIASRLRQLRPDVVITWGPELEDTAIPTTAWSVRSSLSFFKAWDRLTHRCCCIQEWFGVACRQEKARRVCPGQRPRWNA